MNGLIMALAATVFGIAFIGVAVGVAIYARNSETPQNRRARRTIDALILAGIGAIWLAAALLIVCMSLPTPPAMMHTGLRV